MTHEVPPTIHRRGYHRISGYCSASVLCDSITRPQISEEQIQLIRELLKADESSGLKTTAWRTSGVAEHLRNCQYLRCLSRGMSHREVCILSGAWKSHQAGSNETWRGSDSSLSGQEPDKVSVSLEMAFKPPNLELEFRVIQVHEEHDVHQKHYLPESMKTVTVGDFTKSGSRKCNNGRLACCNPARSMILGKECISEQLLCTKFQSLRHKLCRSISLIFSH